MFILLISLALLIIFLFIIIYAPFYVDISIDIADKVIIKKTYKCLAISLYSKSDVYMPEQLLDKLLQFSNTKKEINIFPRLSQMRQIKCQTLNWMTTIGLHQADHTAIFVGLLISCKSLIITGFSEYFDAVNGVNYVVKPIYNHAMFHSHCQCMFSMRLGHAIHMYFRRSNSN
ncbi:DUF2953 domain-containing protein [Amphibacillus jilinensis]|uniref:DUF2953 domain-containing protein n=1 Tax=Amphibacillus jilinensis TaxID=1216008 RepID=UPI00031845C7|nr:DUF2953 domain-containing protein [Amphibacillus jilinensis]